MKAQEHIAFLKETIELGKQLKESGGDIGGFNKRITTIRKWGEDAEGGNILVNKKLKDLPDFDSEEFQKTGHQTALQKLVSIFNKPVEPGEEEKEQLRKKNYLTKMILECEALIYYYKHRD